MAGATDASIEARLSALERAQTRHGNPGDSRDIVTLRDYFEARITALEKATSLAATTMERRLDGMNEFRATLKDQAGRFITRDELNIQMLAINETLKSLQSYRDQMEGKASAASVYVAMGLSLLGLAIGMASLLGG